MYLMAAVTREQAEISGAIQTSVRRLNDATQQNAAMVQEISAASQILNDEAGSLEDMVSRFRK